MGSFTKAAQELGYAQSSVTAQVQRLEATVGTPLFDRLTNGIRLTSVGEQMLPYTRQILDLMAEATNLGEERDLTGTLRVGTMESIASFRLLPLVEYMHLRHPKLHLSMRPSLCQQTTESIRRGNFDCGFFMDTKTSFPDVEVELLAEEKLVLVAAPGHALAQERQLTLERVSKERILGTEPGCAYRDGFEDLLSEECAEPFPVLEFGTIDSIKRGVSSGLGIALLPQVACLTELEAGGLIALDWTPPFTVRTYVAWRKGSGLTRAVAALVEASRKIVDEQRVEFTS